MSQVFISYSHKDQDFALYLAYRLSLYGVAIWIDESQIYAGDKLKASILAGLKASDALVLIISPDSLSSNEVAVEWEYFLGLDNPRLIIPVVLRKVEKGDIPPHIGTLLYIDDFLNQRGFDNGFGKLLNSLLKHGLDINLTQGSCFYRKAKSFEEIITNKTILPQDLLAIVKSLVDLFRNAKQNSSTVFLNKDESNKTFRLRNLLDEKLQLDHFGNDIYLCIKYIDEHLVSDYLPLYMQDFVFYFNQLLYSKCLFVAENTTFRLIVMNDSLLLDESFLSLLLGSIEKGTREYEKRAKARRNYVFPLDRIHQSIAASGLNIDGLSSLAIDEQLKNNESRLTLSCGEAKVHWKTVPTSEEKNLAIEIAQRFIDTNFWYLSNMWANEYFI